MNQNQWIPLLQYSAKYGVSLSTLRRRIKTNTIPFKLDQGKYFLLDSAPAESEAKTNYIAQATAPAPVPANQPPPLTPAATTVTASPSLVEASVLSSAHKLVEELKTAYAKILQEKEEQISQLKEEIVDLRMLVRILEDQSTRQRVEVQQAPAPENFVFGDYSLEK
mgnify:CR=1 FL=1